MIKVEIPGRGMFNFENAVFDYNGTIAVDGDVNSETEKNIKKLGELLNIYILTADTYGTVNKKCGHLPAEIKVFPGDEASKHKKEIVENLKGQTICFGNGFNDIEMFKSADLSVCIIDEEGCCGKIIAHSDIVVKSINDGFNLLFRTNRIKADLRG